MGAAHINVILLRLSVGRKQFSVRFLNVAYFVFKMFKILPLSTCDAVGLKRIYLEKRQTELKYNQYGRT